MSTSTRKPASNGAKANGAAPSKSSKTASSGEQAKAATATTNGASASAEEGDVAAPSEAVHIAKLTGGKPDPDDNNAKLEAIKKEIDAAHAEIVSG